MASKDFLRNFISTYKSLPNLWDTKRLDYNNKAAREVAYQKLIKLSKRYYSQADRNWVANKIQNLRSTYKRERKKILWQRQCGGPEYKTSLWYYSLLCFIDGEEDELEETDESKDQSINEDEYEGEAEYVEEEELEYQETTALPKNNRKRQKLNSSPSMEPDEYDAMGISWAAKMRKLDHIQRILAEDLINVILTKAFFKELTRDTRLENSWQDTDRK